MGQLPFRSTRIRYPTTQNEKAKPVLKTVAAKPRCDFTGGTNPFLPPLFTKLRKALYIRRFFSPTQTTHPPTTTHNSTIASPNLQSHFHFQNPYTPKIPYPLELCKQYTMQLSTCFLFALHALAVYAQAAGNTATTTKRLEKYVKAPGLVVDTANTNAKVERADTIPAEAAEIFELDPDTLTPAIGPDNSDDDSSTTAPSHRRHARGELSRRSCEPMKPWLCERKTCFNMYTHNCCKGGHLCKDPAICYINTLGQMACRE